MRITDCALRRVTISSISGSAFSAGTDTTAMSTRSGSSFKLGNAGTPAISSAFG
jgi:hypothetical protein